MLVNIRAPRTNDEIRTAGPGSHLTRSFCIHSLHSFVYSETADLIVNVIEGKDLLGLDPDPTSPFDSYVRVYLLPDKTTNMQTRVSSTYDLRRQSVNGH